MKKHILATIFILLIFVLSACGPNPIAIGEKAPDFTLRNLDGKEVSLKDSNGKAVLINFWGAWCPPCTIEMPDIVDRSITYSDELVVMAVNYGDSLKTVRDFTNQMSLSFSPLLDLTGDVVDLYLVSGYPTSIFIDSEGVIQMIHVGYMDAEQLDQYLDMINVGGR
jgi:peroxiredoxin